MASTELDELKLCVEELEKLLATAQLQKVKEVLKANLVKLNSDLATLQTQIKRAEQVPSAPRCYDVKLNNYAWDESDKLVKIYVTLKNVQALKESDVFCKFSPRSVELHVLGLGGRNYYLVLNSLVEDIDVKKSYWKVKTDMVAVYLVKSTPGLRWSYITLPEKKAKEAKLPKMDTGGNADPSQSLMHMMKQMYEDGDDEMKRTIAKAWTESREKQLNDNFGLDV